MSNSKYNEVMSNLENNSSKDSNQDSQKQYSESLQQLQSEGLVGSELGTLDSEMMATLKGADHKSPVAGSVLHITMAAKQPQKIKNLIASNFGNNPKSSIRLKQVKQFRRNMAIRNYGKTNYVFDPALNYNPLAPDPLAAALTNMLIGNSASDAKSVNLAHQKFIRYLTAVLASKDEYQAARLFAAHHFGDSTIFDQFPDLAKDTMDAYNRFAGLVKESTMN